MITESDLYKRTHRMFVKFIKEEVHGADFGQGNSEEETLSIFYKWWNKNKSNLMKES